MVVHNNNKQVELHLRGTSQITVTACFTHEKREKKNCINKQTLQNVAAQRGIASTQIRTQIYILLGCDKVSL